MLCTGQSTRVFCCGLKLSKKEVMFPAVSLHLTPPSPHLPSPPSSLPSHMSIQTGPARPPVRYQVTSKGAGPQLWCGWPCGDHQPSGGSGDGGGTRCDLSPVRPSLVERDDSPGPSLSHSQSGLTSALQTSQDQKHMRTTGQ